jgi:hypothetical protein
MNLYDGQILVCVSSPCEGVEEGDVCQVMGTGYSSKVVPVHLAEPAVKAETYFRSGTFGPYPPFTGELLLMTHRQVERHFMDEYEWGLMRRRQSRIEGVLAP